jgi:hypothetical protein
MPREENVSGKIDMIPANVSTAPHGCAANQTMGLRLIVSQDEMGGPFAG